MSERCPICGRSAPAGETPNPHRPFCSLRCRQVDLVRWSEGRYAITEPLCLPRDEDAQETVDDLP